MYGLAVLQGDEPVVDPELGRVIEPWRTGQVDLVREALLRYGPDRMDKVVQQVRHTCATLFVDPRNVCAHSIQPSPLHLPPLRSHVRQVPCTQCLLVAQQFPAIAGRTPLTRACLLVHCCRTCLCLQCHEIEPLKSRQADEIAQLVKAMLLTLEEMGRLAPALQQEEKAARDAATAAAAAAAAAGDPAGAAAAQAQLKSHGNMSVQYVNGLRDALIKAGLGDKLPHACSKVCQGAAGRMSLNGSCYGSTVQAAIW